MNIYAERLRELEDALDKVTRDWLLDVEDGMYRPTCQYCGCSMSHYWEPREEPFKHAETCPRTILANDRIGYVRR